MSDPSGATETDQLVLFDVEAEFDRQVQTLLDKGYPAVTGLTASALAELVEPLREVVLARGAMSAPSRARVPFLLVIDKALAPVYDLMPLTQLNGKPGFADFDPDDLGRFETVKEVALPSSPAYVVFDVDRGSQTRNLAPNEALEQISAAGRTALTVSEGIAFITQFPMSLETNNCFSLVASRCGDKRVPALWISKGAPKLGWCWAGNPHTWLGSASCADRAAPTADTTA